MYCLSFCRPNETEPVTLTDVPRCDMGKAAVVARLLWRQFHGSEVSWEEAPALAKREQRRRDLIAAKKLYRASTCNACLRHGPA